MRMIELQNGQLSSMDFKATIPPCDNEMEISVFGQGFGECIAICCGHRNYVIIDSFVNRKTGKPIALEYLSSMGLPPSCIKQVVITHWHKDHIEGAAEILKEASPDVEVVLNPIVKNDKFNKLIERGAAEKNESVSEFEKIYDFISCNGYKNVIVSTCRSKIYSNHGTGEVELFSLSPQDNEIFKYISSLNIPKESQQVSYVYPSDNLLSIVLLARIANKGFLFGGDMENSLSEDSGWPAIVSQYDHQDVDIDIFKIPHHGSITGHNDAVWDSLIKKKPISVITSFIKLKNPLPTEDDVARICKMSERTFVLGKREALPKYLERKLRKSNAIQSIHSLDSEIGIVRYRQTLNCENPRLEYYGAAKEHFDES